MIISSNVITLTDANFETEVLGSALPVMVFMYVPWTARCKILAPTICSFADDNLPLPMVVGQINGDENTITRTAYGISGYPHILFFNKGIRHFPPIDLTKATIGQLIEYCENKFGEIPTELDESAL